MNTNVRSLSIFDKISYPCIIPSDNEMYVKNAKDLKRTQLCQFLEEMDNQERDLQNKSNPILEGVEHF